MEETRPNARGDISLINEDPERKGCTHRANSASDSSRNAIVHITLTVGATVLPTVNGIVHITSSDTLDRTVLPFYPLLAPNKHAGHTQ